MVVFNTDNPCLHIHTDKVSESKHTSIVHHLNQ